MESYNMLLYNKRVSRCLKPRQFDKVLNIHPFRYYLIENGYIKPNRKDIKKISSALEIDYLPYTEGESSYPEEKKDIRKHFLKIFDFLGCKVFRIVIASLCVICLTTAAVSGIILNRYSNSRRSFYTDTYLELFDRLAENGSLSISLTGTFTRPEIYTVEEDKYVSLKGEYNTDNVNKLDFKTIYCTMSNWAF